MAATRKPNHPKCDSRITPALRKMGACSVRGCTIQSTHYIRERGLMMGNALVGKCCTHAGCKEFQRDRRA